VTLRDPGRGIGGLPDLLWVVVPCMGRLVHLRQTLPSLLRQPGIRYCLVDYACPDRCGEWVRRSHRECMREGRIIVETVPTAVRFNKGRAYNRGAARAIRQGARFLCFLDADTRVRPSFGRWLQRHLRRDRFLIAGLHAGVWYVRGTGGILVVSAHKFTRSGGYDESFHDWGAEDIEMRLRLHLLRGPDFGEIPVHFFWPIAHADALRTRYYRIKNHLVSYERNRRRLERRVRAWTGRGLAELPPGGRRLDMLTGHFRRLDGRIVRRVPSRASSLGARAWLTSDRRTVTARDDRALRDTRGKLARNRSPSA